MAETITRQYREPFVETAGLAATEEGLRLLKRDIPTASFTGRQFVAGESDLEKQAREAAAGLRAGPEAYQDYMSPYQREVIDTSIAALDREQERGLNALRQRAIQGGAFGGGREAAMLGYQQALQAAIQGLQAQQGLGTFQSALGAQQRQLNQGQLAADQEAAREAAFADFTRLGLVGPQLASVIGGFPAATQTTSAPPPSTAQTLLGLGIGGAGLAGAVKSLF